MSIFDAVRTGVVANVRALAAGPALESRDVNGCTPFLAAVAARQLPVVQALVSLGACTSVKDLADRCALLVAAGEGDVTLFSYLLANCPEQKMAVSKSGNTALHRAAAYGHVAIVDTLLAADGMAIDIRNAEGATPLLRAARWGHADVVTRLLQHGASLMSVDNAGKSAADWARSKGHADALLALSSVPTRAQSPAVAGAAAAPAPTPTPAPASVAVASELDAVDVPETQEVELGRPMHVEGWMAKQGHFIKNWKNRWFVLEGRYMTYYSSPQSTKPRGIIAMVEGSDVVVEERYVKPFCFTIVTPAKRFVLQAANDSEMVEWIEAIQNNLECCSADDMGAVADAGDDD